MKPYVLETMSGEPICEFDDFIDGRHFMRNLEHCRIVRASDNVVLSIKKSHNEQKGPFVKLISLASPMGIK